MHGTLVKQVAVMLLDEATSAMDAELDRCVQEALECALRWGCDAAADRPQARWPVHGGDSDGVAV